MATRSRGQARAACAVRGEGIRPGGHEYATLDALARRLAGLMGHDYAGMLDARGGPPPVSPYVVPGHTLLARDARALGVRDGSDLFGGVVPHAFVATKVISHPVLRDAVAPTGWRHGLGADIEGAVLPGYAVFSERDARQAFMRLRGHGLLRLKPARGIGGQGQVLLDHPDELDAALAGLPPGELERHGAAIELHLHGHRTLSVGWATCGRVRISYLGTQRTTRNRRGGDAYGGSDLWVARGGFGPLLDAGVPPSLERGLRCVQAYHSAVARHFPGFFASRCNYDVVQGHDQQGRPWTGVLEQSWRIGGASPAEIAAMRAFARDPSLHLVRASSHEIHGACVVPPGADVHYRGVDPHCGELVKYSVVARHGH